MDPTSTWIEKIDTLTSAPWAENTIDVCIDRGIKEEVAKKHQTEYTNTNLTTDQLYFYTDRSLLKGKVAAGVTAYQREEKVAEETYNLGEEIKVFVSEHYEVEKATEIAKKYTRRQ